MEKGDASEKQAVASDRFSAGMNSVFTAAAANGGADMGDSDLLRQFRSNGYIIVEELFTREEMADWKEHIRENLSQCSQTSTDPSTGREVAATVTGVSVWMAAGQDPSSELACPPYFVRALTSSKIGVILRQIMGGGCEFLSTKPVLKNSKVRHASPWHQDYPYWKGTNKVSLWVAVDDARVENGCLKVVPCSHVAELPHEEHREAVAFDHRVSESLVSDSIDVQLGSGSVLFFHDLLLHASHPNTNGADRYSMIATYRSRMEEDPDPLGVWPGGSVKVNDAAEVF
eukprot:TRINITY_DN28370_c0_g2_i1.p1 TRINITY_DN28370_c0_g2~~TRINITY_DN28370_c0_g2_i1.p1  ORF type:complete len:286 (-),score=37.36 TRINITY_DN28370_c0_g2_i1:70-927(-)